MVEESIIRLELDKAYEFEDDGCPFPGMSYTQGVSAALAWVLDDINDSPYEEE